jgi:3,4-dihydroxy 2-butanone 4-phosphate synthase/GTP cyclohydrolase II
MGLDTVEANERLGFPADLRDYGMGAQMLNDLGIKQIRLITNNPRKIAGLKGYGIEMVERVPLFIEANDYNTNYLATKAEKLGHLLLQTYLIIVAIDFKNPLDSATQRYEKLEKLRSLIKTSHFSLQEETRSIAMSIFSKPAIIFHLGFDKPNFITNHWYGNPDHPYLQAILNILDEIANLSDLKTLQFFMSDGYDPMLGLQVNLKRENFSLSTKPSTLTNQLETQKIYIFS